MKMGWVFAAVLLMTRGAMAQPAPDAPDAESGHVMGTPGEGSGALSREKFEARFGTDAAKLLAKSPDARADRFAAYDIAWPRNAGEEKRLGGNTVMVVGALSRDASELPLAKVYLERSGGGAVELQRLGLVSRSLAASSQAAKAFGPNVTEEFYLVPIGALGRDVMLKCDFAKKRVGFILSKSLAPLTDSASAQSAARQPLAAAVRAMVAREYPGFGVSLTGGAK